MVFSARGRGRICAWLRKVLLLKHACMHDTCTHNNVQYIRSCVHICPHVVHVQQRFGNSLMFSSHSERSLMPPTPSCNIKETEQSLILHFNIREPETERESIFQKKKCLWNTVLNPIVNMTETCWAAYRGCVWSHHRHM